MRIRTEILIEPAWTQGCDWVRSYKIIHFFQLEPHALAIK